LLNRVLLIGWDAADWKVINPLIENGQLPNLSRFLEEGVMADMITLEPILSPMLWNSIATGKRADQHGILGFTEVDPASGRVRPVSSTSRTSKALWNILSQNGYRTNVVGWFGAHPAERINGACVSDALARGFPPESKPWPMLPGAVFPEALSPVLESLRVRPHEIDPAIIRLFVPRAAEIDQTQPPGPDSDRPNLLPVLAKLMAECFTLHSAATYVMEHHPWDFMAAYYISIDHFSHAFMGYHPPKPDWIDQGGFDLYHDVVNSAYRFHDLMLGRLLDLAGLDTTVILASDHGFHSDHLRPREIPNIPAGPASQHRPLGIFAMKGPGIKRDERIYGVSLLDVAPTVLTLFGLPAGKDMPGRVLTEAFEIAPPLERIPTWETVEGPHPDGMHLAGYEMPSEDADLLLEQFVALGYVDEPGENFAAAREDCERERKWNLARVYTSTWRMAEALPLLEELHQMVPERSDFALTLANCQLRLGLLEEARATVHAAIENHVDTPAAQFVLGAIEYDRGDYTQSLKHLRAAEHSHAAQPEFYTRLGLTYLKLRRLPDAQAAFRRAATVNPHSPMAHQGIARVYLRQGDWENAADSALASISFHHDTPLSHLILGVALLRLERPEHAARAFETALSFHPPLGAVHRWLAMAYNRIPGRKHEAEHQRIAAREFLALRRRGFVERESLRQQARFRAYDRAEAVSKARVEAAPIDDVPVDDGKARYEFVIVSGLPRSGTSLMMRMLDAAGVPVMADGQRNADIDNPEGYYEWETIRKLPRKPEILREANGKAIKVISMLLPALPRRHRYKIVFMDRPIAEVVASQVKMIRRRERVTGKTGPAADPNQMAQMLGEHRETLIRQMKEAKGFELLIVDYPDLVRSPDTWVEKVHEFLGPRWLGDGGEVSSSMKAVIRPDLHRNRE
jgi:tetratricopeptide (TPR) repeat protein